MPSINITVDSSSGQTKVPFMVTQVAILTPSNAITPTFGQWICLSPYLGRANAGKYYLKQVARPQCTEAEQVWMGACPTFVNPVAFFFDDPNGSYGPFLALESFDLTSKRAGTKYGRILRYGPAPAYPSLVWDY